MIERITDNDLCWAIIIRSEYAGNEIEFFTPTNLSQQLGNISRSKGYLIEPHFHPPVDRIISQTIETLIVRKGKVRIDLYDANKVLFKEVIINKNDVILLAGYGHGFEMLEDSELIEVKQGPYLHDGDKLPITESNALKTETITA